MHEVALRIKGLIWPPSIGALILPSKGLEKVALSQEKEPLGFWLPEAGTPSSGRQERTPTNHPLAPLTCRQAPLAIEVWSVL